EIRGRWSSRHATGESVGFTELLVEHQPWPALSGGGRIRGSKSKIIVLEYNHGQRSGTGARRDDVASLGSLGAPTRRALYGYVSRQGEPVGRDEAAAAAGIGRTLAAYHLDRMVEDGLLEVSFARRTGRRGPGAGRPAKLYRRASREFSISLPPRDY